MRQAQPGAAVTVLQSPTPRMRQAASPATMPQRMGMSRKKPLPSKETSTVAASQNAAELRWLARSAWCETVSVTPEVSSSAVLMVGSQNGPIVVNGSTIPAGPACGHEAVKSGHSSLWSKSPSMDGPTTEWRIAISSCAESPAG